MIMMMTATERGRRGGGGSDVVGPTTPVPPKLWLRWVTKDVRLSNIYIYNNNKTT